MDQKKIDRINELARKSRIQALTQQEKEEQARLRQEFIESYRRSLQSQLDSIVLVDEERNRTPLRRKQED